MAKVTYKDWYQRPENKTRLSEERKKRYHSDPVYRQSILDRATKARKDAKQKPKVVSLPKGFDCTLLQVATSMKKSPATIRDWVSKGYLPSPTVFKRRFVFTHHQVQLIKKVKEYLATKGSKTGIHLPEFEDLKAFIAVNWS